MRRRSPSAAALLVLALSLLAATRAETRPPSVVPGNHVPGPTAKCRFSSVGGRWVGSCGPLFGQHPTLTLAPARAITTGVWRTGVVPSTVWAGEITDSGYPNARIEVEVYPGGSGVLRTDEGWLLVSRFERAPRVLRFEVDTTREVPPSDVDREIVRRAASLLSSATTWNRADDRTCAPAASTWSLYCALQRATIEVAGAFHHRRPALEVVRQLVEERTAGRPYQHRLRDYNNDPSTQLDDVRSLFAEALTRMAP